MNTYRLSSGKPQFEAWCHECGYHAEGYTEAAWQALDHHSCPGKGAAPLGEPSGAVRSDDRQFCEETDVIATPTRIPREPTRRLPWEAG